LLIARYFGPLAASGVNYWQALIVGLRMDTIAAGVLLAPPTLLLFLTPLRWRRAGVQALFLYFLALLLTTVYMEIATPPFFSEFEARPNELFVNYLIYPREVMSTIFSTQLTPLLLAVLCLSLLTWLYLRWRRKTF